jgi:hypothetical protein
MNMKWIFTLTLLGCLAGMARAQEENANPDHSENTLPDTIRVIGELPFPISEEKRLSPEDIANKKEGWYITGLPEPRIDPIKGLGIGTHISLFNNKDRSDPFFYYTPYRIRYLVGLRAATSGQYRGRLTVDMPFAFNTRWRLRGDMVYERDPNFQYYGLGTRSLGGLSYVDKQTGKVVTGARMSEYKKNLARTRPGRGPAFGENPARQYTDVHYNEFEFRQFLAALAVERTFFEGRMRLLLGYEMLFANISPYDGQEVSNATHAQTGESVPAIQGRTLLTEEYLAARQGDENSYWARKNISGYTGGRIANFQTSLMWDTRDLEPDPSKGVFLEYAQEISLPALGSQFNFSKHLVQGMWYNQILPTVFRRMVFASRVGFGTVRGSNIPFTELLDQWSATVPGGIRVLGGERSLRGYKEYRFTGMVYGWGNFELRTRLFDTRILNQHLAVSLVPFYDVGRVWDDLSEIRLKNFRGAPGLGARIAWNQATILRFDYARSVEDAQLFFTLEHPF